MMPIEATLVIGTAVTVLVSLLLFILWDEIKGRRS